MNICKWCNKKVSDHETVWYRRNLILGYSFCSTKCATQWKSADQDSKSKTNDSSNSTNEDVPNESIDYGNFTSKSKKIDNFSEEVKSIQSLQNQLTAHSHNNDKSDEENAKKIMFIVRKLLPQWKIIISALIVILAVLFYLNTMYGQILSYILITLLIGVIWAYFNDPKE